MTRLTIIGGGPAGLHAALEAVRRGFDVTLLEKGCIGEEIRCAEGFFDTMKLLGKPTAGVLFKVDKIVARAEATYEIDAKDFSLWMMDRATWQRSLRDRAKGLGVKVMENTPVSPEGLERLKGQCDYIIDASGAPSVTSRIYGFHDFYKDNSGKTVQYVMEGDFSHIGQDLKVGLMEDFWGYYWIFPKKIEKKKGVANVGVGNFNPTKKDKLWQRLDKVLEKEGLAGDDYKIVKKTGGICPTKMLERLHYDNIILVGDSAGLTSPLHDGGIDMAIISAKKAIDAIATDVDSYEGSLQRAFAKKLRFEELLTMAWRQRDFYEMDELLSKVEKLKINRHLANPNRISRPALKAMKKLLLKEEVM